MRGTFVLLHLLNAFLNGRTSVEVPYAPAPSAVHSAVHGIAGSGARFGVRARDVAEPAAAGGVLENLLLFFEEIEDGRTHNTSIVCDVDGGDQVSFNFAPTYELSAGGRRVDAGVFTTRTIPGWRANISGTSTTGRDDNVLWVQES